MLISVTAVVNTKTGFVDDYVISQVVVGGIWLTWNCNEEISNNICQYLLLVALLC